MTCPTYNVYYYFLRPLVNVNCEDGDEKTLLISMEIIQNWWYSRSLSFIARSALLWIWAISKCYSTLNCWLPHKLSRKRWDCVSQIQSRTRLFNWKHQSKMLAHMAIYQPHNFCAMCKQKVNKSTKWGRKKLKLLCDWKRNFFCLVLDAFLKKETQKSNMLKCLSSLFFLVIRLSTPHRIIIRYNSYTLTQTPKPCLPILCFSLFVCLFDCKLLFV